jgi:truncated hemoglobin YjbI
MEQKAQADTDANEGPQCPFQDIARLPSYPSEAPTGCPFHAHAPGPNQHPFDDVTLNVQRGEHNTSEQQGALLADIGGGDRIREFLTRFYARAFQDNHIKDFFFMNDGAPAHAKRLGDWIIQKMGGEGVPWTDSGRWGKRQQTHLEAWKSPKRDPAHYGRRFKLDDCRIWMRLNFWAARECGLRDHEGFWSWYVDFIEHFIAFYEYKAPMWTREDAAWSSEASNHAEYAANGNLMLDLIDKW